MSTNTFTLNKDAIARASLRLVNAFNSGDNPRPEQMTDAIEALNIMLKSWQVEGFLWLRKFALLALVPGQHIYYLGAGSTDTCVYAGTATQISRPTRITSAMYRNSAGFDREMTPLGRADYMKLTNKLAAFPPTQYLYDPQLGQGELTTWGVPNEAGSLFFSCDRGIYDILTDEDAFDVPQEWLRCIKWGLAVEIAPEYAVPAGELARLEARYIELKTAISAYDREIAPTQMEMA